MKLLTTLSALALLSACAVHQPDPCDATTPEECSDRSHPTPEPEGPTDEPEHEPDEPEHDDDEPDGEPEHEPEEEDI